MSENSLMDKLAFAISILTSTVAFFIIGAISYATFDGYGLTYFSWHPPLMSIGLFLLMTQAIVIYSGDHFIFNEKPTTKSKLKIHWILQAFAATCITIAFICIWIQKVKLESEHITTVHAILGLTAYILWLISIVIGITTAYAAELRHVIKPIILKILHPALGILSYSLGMVASFYGIEHGAENRMQLSTNWIYGLNILVGIIWIAAILSPILSLGRKSTTLLNS